MIIWKNILIEQNRKTTEKENLELKNNIMQLGLINPITLIKVDDNQFKVVAGRRRAMALQELYPNGLEEKHYRIMDKDEKIIAFSENSIRKNLSMREEIEQLKQLKEQCPDATIKELALRLGRSQSTITRSTSSNQRTRKRCIDLHERSRRSRNWHCQQNQSLCTPRTRTRYC